MFHYGHQSSYLLTITDDETDSGHAVTDNGVQGSFCLWFPAELLVHTSSLVPLLCRALVPASVITINTLSV